MAIYYGNTKVKPSGISKVYVGNTLVYQSTQPVLKDYFYLASQAGNCNVVFIKNGTTWATQPTIEYSYNKTSWSSVQFGTTIQINRDQTIYFRGDYVVESTSNYINIKTTTVDNGYLEAGGDLVTLVANSSMPIDKFSNSHTFYKLFAKNRRLYDATYLYCSATIFSSNAFRETFHGCTSLSYGMGTITINPDGASTLLPPNLFNMTYYNCTSLLKSTKLNMATALKANIYTFYCMYMGCTSLTYVCNLNLYGASSSAFAQMYRGCTSLYVSDTQVYPAGEEWKLPQSSGWTTLASNTLTMDRTFTGCLGTRSTDDLVLELNQTNIYYTQEQPV